MKKIFGIIIFIAAWNVTHASGLQEIVARANKAYADGMYENAADLYGKILSYGYESADLYYNLGNAYFKMNDFAPAILNYERAKRLDPGNEDIRFNLQVAATRITDKIEPLPVLFYKRWYKSLLVLLPVDGWARAGIGALILALGSGLLYFISRILILRKIGFWAGLVFLFFSLVFSLFAWQNYTSVRNNTEAIVFDPTVTIKSSPDEKSIDLFVLHEGTKVQVIDRIGPWFEIRIANGSVGWLPASSVEKI